VRGCGRRQSAVYVVRDRVAGLAPSGKYRGPSARASSSASARGARAERGLRRGNPASSACARGAATSSVACAKAIVPRARAHAAPRAKRGVRGGDHAARRDRAAAAALARDAVRRIPAGAVPRRGHARADGCRVIRREKERRDDGRACGDHMAAARRRRAAAAAVAVRLFVTAHADGAATNRRPTFTPYTPRQKRQNVRAL
jgi:hypothetical protein